MKSTEFRILGAVFSEPDSYVDAEIAGISGTGTLHFDELSGSREWELAPDRVETLRDNNHLIERDAVADHKLWQRLDSLTTDVMQGKVTSSDGKRGVTSGQRCLFEAACAEMRSNE